MNNCIKRKTAHEGVIKISHYYMSEIVKLCIYTIENTKTDNTQNIRSQRILKRIRKYLIQTGKDKSFQNYYKQPEPAVLPIED